MCLQRWQKGQHVVNNTDSQTSEWEKKSISSFEGGHLCLTFLIPWCSVRERTPNNYILHCVYLIYLVYFSLPKGIVASHLKSTTEGQEDSSLSKIPWYHTCQTYFHSVARTHMMEGENHKII